MRALVLRACSAAALAASMCASAVDKAAKNPDNIAVAP